jgi:biotin carboxyl carrier protein
MEEGGALARHASMKERTAVIGNEHVAIVWTESGGTLKATVNGREYELEVRRLGTGAFWFGSSGRSAESVVTPQNDGYEVAINGYRIHVEFLESSKRPHRQGAATDSGAVDVRAPMPGKVVRVLAGKSDEVRAHQGIVVIEAMKMQNEIRSPKDGRIVELTVAEGDAVGLGQLIARVE